MKVEKVRSALMWAKHIMIMGLIYYCAEFCNNSAVHLLSCKYIKRIQCIYDEMFVPKRVDKCCLV